MMMLFMNGNVAVQSSAHASFYQVNFRYVIYVYVVVCYACIVHSMKCVSGFKFRSMLSEIIDVEQIAKSRIVELGKVDPCTKI